MNFFENQETIIQVLTESLHVNHERVKNTIALCNYLDSEFYDPQEDEDAQVALHVTKQLQVIAQKMITDLQNAFDEAHIEYGVDIPTFCEPYEGLFYLWGITKEANIPVKKPAFKRYGMTVSNPHHVIVLIDIRQGVQIVPWNQ